MIDSGFCFSSQLIYSLLYTNITSCSKSVICSTSQDNYPCVQQLLIYNEKVLKDETTLADNKVAEDGFLVVMLSKVNLSSICTRICLLKESISFRA